jgi:4-hydroxybenzoate polyprenyltransferase
MKDRLRDFYLLTRLHKPIGILLLLWPTLWALWIAAGGVPDLRWSCSCSCSA